MLVDATGSIFDSGADALVNPVNCGGVMGAGLAKQFKDRFPEMYMDYRSLCARGAMHVGKMHFCHYGEVTQPVIVNFPTKRRYWDKSDTESISIGLRNLVANLRGMDIYSIAIPALGCGLGGLDWADVRPLIVAAFAELPEVTVMLYGPEAHRGR